KNAEKAKELELSGWSYPKHLAGRAFGVVVHGDVAGTENVRRALTDWLSWMGLVPSGDQSLLDRVIGYYEPYATSHDTLDRDRGEIADADEREERRAERATPVLLLAPAALAANAAVDVVRRARFADGAGADRAVALGERVRVSGARAFSLAHRRRVYR